MPIVGLLYHQYDLKPLLSRYVNVNVIDLPLLVYYKVFPRYEALKNKLLKKKSININFLMHIYIYIYLSYVSHWFDSL